MPNVLLENVSKSFGTFHAVDDVSLDIAEGEFVTLLGPSGCGKTTTLRMVAGLEAATAGRISIAGRVVADPVLGISVPPERRGLGMVFQSYAIWPHMSVYENVAYPLQVQKWKKSDIRGRVLEALDQVEMAHLAERASTALSGGQQQRVAIARALVARPSVLLLDEPLSNLDARLRMQMGDELRALQLKTGITSLYVTHDQSEAMALSDRVVVMQSGRILQIDTPTGIYHRPASTEVAKFFGSPNLFTAAVRSVAGAADGNFKIEVETAGWRGHALSGTGYPEQAAVSVMIRPEAFGLAKDRIAEPDMIAVTGQVLSCVFRGPSQSALVDTQLGRMSIELPSHRLVKTGDRLSLVAPWDTAWIISEAGGDAAPRQPAAMNPKEHSDENS